MSLLSSPYFPVKVSRSSNTGVSMETAPWRLKTEVMVCKGRGGMVSAPWRLKTEVMEEEGTREERGTGHE